MDKDNIKEIENYIKETIPKSIGDYYWDGHGLPELMHIYYLIKNKDEDAINDLTKLIGRITGIDDHENEISARTKTLKEEWSSMLRKERK